MEDLAQTTQPNPEPTSVSQPDPQVEEVKEGSSKGLFIAAGVVVLIVLLALAGYFLMKGNSKKTAYVPPVPVNNQVTQAPTMTPTPTPLAVQNKSDVTNYLNELNSTNTTSMQADYNQAVSESSNL